MTRPPLKAPELLEKEFLELRAKIIDCAATLDRLDRAEGTLGDDRRMKLLRQALEELASAETGRAERIQNVFSLPYDPEWRKILR